MWVFRLYLFNLNYINSMAVAKLVLQLQYMLLCLL